VSDDGGKNYNDGGFTQTDDGSVFRNLDSSGTAANYDTWDWKQIEAAIVGGSAMVDTGWNQNRASSISDPEEIQRTAQALFAVQQTLQMVAQSMSDQAKALAGPQGPWKGAAADAFSTMMDIFSKQVRANAEVLSGGSTGAHSVPQQLADSALHLSWAMTTIQEIDGWYAQQAQSAYGVEPMENGLVPISQKPVLVRMMSEDMRKVLKILAANYHVTIDSIRQPPGITGAQTSTLPADTTGTSSLDSLGIGGDNGVGGGNENSGTGAVTSFPGDLSGSSAGSPGASASDLDSALTPAASASSGDAASGLSGLDSGLNSPTSAVDASTGTVTPFPGLSGLGSGLTSSGLGGAENGTALSTNGNLSTADPSTWGKEVSSFPESTNLASLGSDPGTTGLTSDPAKAFPGSTSAGSGIPSLQSSGPDAASAALKSGLAANRNGGPGVSLTPTTSTSVGSAATNSGMGGMPMMPMGGMGMGGAGAGGSNAGERSDASGLLSGDGKPWVGLTAFDDGEFGSPAGASQGGAGLELPDTGSVMGSQAEGDGTAEVVGAAFADGEGGGEPQVAAGQPAVVDAGGTPSAGAAHEKLPDDRVALPQHAAGAAEDTAAWEVAASSSLPFLWPYGRADTKAGGPVEENVGEEAPRESGTTFATNGVGGAVTSSGVGSAAGSPTATELPIWRPDRSETAATSAGEVAMAGAGSMEVRCTDARPEDDETAAGRSEEASGEEEAGKRMGVADRLRQDEKLWGVASGSDLFG
jgi:uncharacterized protein YukE